MNSKKAKDFLVEQTAQQAALEHVPLSPLEKEMMYFTESDPASCSNPLELNEKFDAEYDTPEYEAKIGRLLGHAYKRLEAENPEAKRTWDDAIRVLKQGDHYILVLTGDFLGGGGTLAGEHRMRDFVFYALIFVLTVVAAILFARLR